MIANSALNASAKRLFCAVLCDLGVKTLHEGGIPLRVEFFCQGVCGADEEFFRTAEERGNLVEFAGGGMVRATAGVEAAVAQAAYFAGRGGATTGGDDVLLLWPVDTVADIAEIQLLGVSISHQAGAGEEITVYTHSDFPLADAAFQLTGVSLVKVGGDFVLDVSQGNGLSCPVGARYLFGYEGVLGAECVEICIAPVAPVVNVETYGTLVMPGQPGESLAEVLYIVGRDNTDGLRARFRAFGKQSEGLCYLCMAASAICIASVGVVHRCGAIYGQANQEVAFRHPCQFFFCQQSAIGGDTEARRHRQPVCMLQGVIVTPGQQLPFQQRFPTEEAGVCTASGAFRFFQYNVDSPLSCFGAHGMLIFAPGVAVGAAQCAIVGEAECAGDCSEHGWCFAQSSTVRPESKRKDDENLLF